MLVSSNASAEEEYRLTGAVTGDRLVELLNIAVVSAETDSVDAYISDAMAQYPAEDFLEELKKSLLALRKNLRGDNRETLGFIIEELDDLALTTFQATDCGRDELNKAAKALKGLHHD